MLSRLALGALALAAGLNTATGQTAGNLGENGAARQVQAKAYNEARAAESDDLCAQIDEETLVAQRATCSEGAHTWSVSCGKQVAVEGAPRVSRTYDHANNKCSDCVGGYDPSPDNDGECREYTQCGVQIMDTQGNLLSESVSRLTGQSVIADGSCAPCNTGSYDPTADNDNDCQAGPTCGTTTDAGGNTVSRLDGASPTTRGGCGDCNYGHYGPLDVDDCTCNVRTACNLGEPEQCAYYRSAEDYDAGCARTDSVSGRSFLIKGASPGTFTANFDNHEIHAFNSLEEAYAHSWSLDCYAADGKLSLYVTKDWKAGNDITCMKNTDSDSFDAFTYAGGNDKYDEDQSTTLNRWYRVQEICATGYGLSVGETSVVCKQSVDCVKGFVGQAGTQQAGTPGPTDCAAIDQSITQTVITQAKYGGDDTCDATLETEPCAEVVCEVGYKGVKNLVPVAGDCPADGGTLEQTILTPNTVLRGECATLATHACQRGQGLYEGVDCVLSASPADPADCTSCGQIVTQETVTPADGGSCNPGTHTCVAGDGPNSNLECAAQPLADTEIADGMVFPRESDDFDLPRWLKVTATDDAFGRFKIQICQTPSNVCSDAASADGESGGPGAGHGWAYNYFPGGSGRKDDTYWTATSAAAAGAATGGAAGGECVVEKDTNGNNVYYKSSWTLKPGVEELRDSENNLINPTSDFEDQLMSATWLAGTSRKAWPKITANSPPTSTNGVDSYLRVAGDPAKGCPAITKVSGCTNPDAGNYDSTANADSSCCWNTDAQKANLDPWASQCPTCVASDNAADTEPTGTTVPHNFYCTNGGTIGGSNTEGCTCTCPADWTGDHCETPNTAQPCSLLENGNFFLGTHSGVEGDCPNTLSLNTGCSPECNTGYYKGTALTYCRSDWDPNTEQQLQKTTCIANACENVQSAVQYKTTATNQNECEDDNNGFTWDNTADTGKKCAKSNNYPANGYYMNCLNQLDSGETCNSGCNAGYTTYDSTTGDELVHTDSETTCTAGALTHNFECDKPCSTGSLSNYDYAVGDCAASLRQGATCQPVCADGYQTTNTNALTTCGLDVDGDAELTHTLVCERTPCSTGYDTANAGTLPTNAEGFDTCADTLGQGSTCKVTCAAGYTSSTATCSMDDMVFTGAVCEPDTCEVRPWPENGNRGNCPSDGQLAHGDSCEPGCDTGYTVSDSIDCSLGDFTAATCNPNGCTVEAPTNGNLGNCNANGVLAHGATCAPECDTGYTVSGSVTCALGEFTAATCSPGCTGVGPPQNGNRGTCPANGVLAHSATCEPTCDTGYTLSASSITCSAGSFTAATCIPKDCTGVGAPENGNLGNCPTDGQLAHGHSCTPGGCPWGHIVSGSITCALGEFTAATCDPKPCDAPIAGLHDNPEHSTHSGCSGLTHGDTCSMKCQTGYTKIWGTVQDRSKIQSSNPATTATCQSGGFVLALPFICVKMGCKQTQFAEYYNAQGTSANYDMDTDPSSCVNTASFGCTDDSYLEYYNAQGISAGFNVFQAGSCVTAKVEGCMDNTKVEYYTTDGTAVSTGANFDDGTCGTDEAQLGCMDNTYREFYDYDNTDGFTLKTANIPNVQDDSACVNTLPTNAGCMDYAFLEYDVSNTISVEGACATRTKGCKNDLYTEYDSAYTEDTNPTHCANVVPVQVIASDLFTNVGGGQRVLQSARATDDSSKLEQTFKIYVTDLDGASASGDVRDADGHQIGTFDLQVGPNAFSVGASTANRDIIWQINNVYFSVLEVNGDTLYPPSIHEIATSVAFTDGFVTGWPRVLVATTTADGQDSRDAQTLAIHVVSLPDGGANFRAYKTLSGGGDDYSIPRALVVGSNSLTVHAVDFNRAVKFQFSSGDVEFDQLSVEDALGYPVTRLFGAADTCTASTDYAKDGSDGEFYCINGGTIGGNPGSCTCTSCSTGYYGDSCQLTNSDIASSGEFTSGSGSWPFVLTTVRIADGTASRIAQKFTMNVVSLPSGGANVRSHEKYSGNQETDGTPQALVVGSNTFTVAAVSGVYVNYDRTVEFQFSSGNVVFNQLSVNAPQTCAAGKAAGKSCGGGSVDAAGTPSCAGSACTDAEFADASGVCCADTQTCAAGKAAGKSCGAGSVDAAGTPSCAGLTCTNAEFADANGVCCADTAVAGGEAAVGGAPSGEEIIHSDEFTDGTAVGWPYVLTATTAAEGTASQSAQSFTMNVISLPSGGAKFRVYKTNANNVAVLGTQQTLVVGSNTFEVTAVNFYRAVKFQFSDGHVAFDQLLVNGVTIYPASAQNSHSSSTAITDCAGFVAGPNAFWPKVLVATTIGDGAASQGAQTFTMNVFSLPADAEVRVYKTTANGGDYSGNPVALQLGSNTITVASVGFVRAVKFQFSSGDVEFDSLTLNGAAVACSSQPSP